MSMSKVRFRIKLHNISFEIGGVVKLSDFTLVCEIGIWLHSYSSLISRPTEA
jgi:hypothetical protein